MNYPVQGHRQSIPQVLHLNSGIHTPKLRFLLAQYGVAYPMTFLWGLYDPWILSLTKLVGIPVHGRDPGRGLRAGRS